MDNEALRRRLCARPARPPRSTSSCGATRTCCTTSSSASRTPTDPYEDLLQVANLGLIKAAQRFDPDRGVRFSTYATAIVDGELRHHLRDSLLMRQPRWVKKVYGEIQAKSAELLRKLGRPPQIERARGGAQHQRGGHPGGHQPVRAHRAAQPQRAVLGRASSTRSPTREVVHSLRQESFALPVEDRIALYGALDKLSAFQRRLIYLLFFKELTQSEVAEEMGLTQKKVSRESIKALGRLKAILGYKLF